jgi:hypothetical protein
MSPRQEDQLVLAYELDTICGFSDTEICPYHGKAILGAFDQTDTPYTIPTELLSSDAIKPLYVV